MAGAESIAFLKVYGVLPAAAAFMVVYSKLANVLSKVRGPRDARLQAETACFKSRTP
jgi:hypothetical protein